MTARRKLCLRAWRNSGDHAVFDHYNRIVNGAFRTDQPLGSQYGSHGDNITASLSPT